MPYPLLLHGKHAPGAVPYQAYGDWLVPWRFGETRAEHRALTEGAGLLDYSTQAALEISGEDRLTFLHNLLTNDINRLAPGQGCRAALLSPEARLIAPMLVLAEAAACWLVCDAAYAAPLAKALEGFIFGERVRITNHERRFASLAIQGRESGSVLEKLGWTVPPSQEDHVIRAWEGVLLRLIRHALIGEHGALLLVEAADAERIWRQLQRAAGDRGRGGGRGSPAAHQRGGTRLTVCGWEAYDIARIEAGIPWFGLDVDASNLLPETGLEKRLASDTKGCYVGQEIVARVATYGSPSQRVRGLLVDGERVPEPGEPIRYQGDDAGRVTSACRSVALGQPVALGMLKRTAYAPGTRVEIRGATATVVESPVGKLSPGGSGRTPGGG